MVVVLGSEGVVEGRDVVVVVVLVVEDCVEEGIFFKCLVGERWLERSDGIFLSRKDGFWAVVYVDSCGYGLYIYIYV